MLLHFIRDKIHHSRQTREPCKSHWRNSYTILNVVTKTHIHSSRTKKHKANKSWESWFRRQRGTSRTLILRDCSLLCTSKWRISVSVLRMAASCLELNRHFFFFFFSLNNGAIPSSEAWVPERLNMGVMAVTFLVRGPVLCLSENIPEGPFWRWPALTLEKRLR